MDDFTLAALRGSIAKWRAIVAGTAKDEGMSNCPLCKMFADKVDPETDQECCGCPVSARTTKDGCSGSPYEQWSKVAAAQILPDRIDWKYADTPARIAAAQAELDFLISLLPAGVSEIDDKSQE